MTPELDNYFNPPKINISKEQFIKRLKFHVEYKAFKNRKKKPVSLEEIVVPVPEIDLKLFKKQK